MFGTKTKTGKSVSGSFHQPSDIVDKERRLLGAFLQLWEEHEDWTLTIEEHLGPLELRIDNEHAVNNARDAHTPHIAEVCRLAFRAFAICSCGIFYPLCTALYALMRRCGSGAHSEQDLDLLVELHQMAESYNEEDDSLSKQ